jgi:hypothetical protein
MVDPHHAMIDGLALAYKAVWELIHDGTKLSAVMGDRHQFSFRVRPAATMTPPTVSVLVDCAWRDVAWLKDGARRLERLPKKFKQAPLDGYERVEVHRLFDEYLLRGQLPKDMAIVPREHFDAMNERAFAEAYPDLHSEASKSHLDRVRNCGAISEAQERALRVRMAKKARKAKGNGAEPAKPAVETEEERRRRQEEDRQRFPDDY